MRGRWFLAIVLGLSIGPQVAHAEERVLSTPAAQPIIVEAFPQGAEVPAPGLGTPGHNAPEPPGKVGPIHAFLHRYGVACWSHHNNPGCGSLKAEITYVFSSCRVWYGEPCFNGPPPDPAKPLGPDTGRRGCGCH
jgi:hypothetical protein